MARRRYQRGSLRKNRKGDRWVGRWWEDVIGADGTPQRIRRTEIIGTVEQFPTRKLAQRRFDQLLEHINSVGYRPSHMAATLEEFAERWKEKVLRQRKPSTQKAAESHLRCYILPRLGRARLDQLGKETVQEFASSLPRNLNRKTVANIMATLASMLNKAKAWGHICEGFTWRDLDLPANGEKRESRFFTLEQARKIIMAAKEPYATMFAVAAMTGIRPGELCGLKIEDLDLDKNLVRIRRSAWYGKLQAPKTRKSAAALPIPKCLADRLRSHLSNLGRRNPLGLVFPSRVGTPMSANNVVQRQLWPILDRLEIPRCGLYAFRHTHASLLFDLSVPATVAQAQLRHTDARVTLGIYGHALGEAHRQAVEQVASQLDSVGLTTEANRQVIQ